MPPSCPQLLEKHVLPASLSPLVKGLPFRFDPASTSAGVYSLQQKLNLSRWPHLSFRQCHSGHCLQVTRMTLGRVYVKDVLEHLRVFAPPVRVNSRVSI